MNEKILDGEYLGVIESICYEYIDDGNLKIKKGIHDIGVSTSYFDTRINEYCIAGVGLPLKEESEYNIGDVVCFKTKDGGLVSIKLYEGINKNERI